MTGYRIVSCGQMSPSIDRNRRWPIQFMDRTPDVYIDKRQIPRRASEQAVNEVTAFWLLLYHDCSPSGWGSRWMDPSFQSHSAGQIQRSRIIHCHPVASPVEIESIAEFPLISPGCAVNSSTVSVPRNVSYHCAASFVKTVSRYQTAARAWRCGRGWRHSWSKCSRSRSRSRWSKRGCCRCRSRWGERGCCSRRNCSCSSCSRCCCGGWSR